MATSGFLSEIRTGRSNAEANPAEYGKPRDVRTHPNRRLQLADLKTFKVTRQTMDKRQGDNGFVILNVVAASGPEAVAIADAAVAEINAPFIVRDRSRLRA